MSRLVAVLAVLAGCSVDLAPDVGPPLTGACDPSDSDPTIDISFAADIRPLMDRPRGMAGCSCHTPTNGLPSGIEQSGLDLGSIHSLRQGGRTSGTDIVIPGDPCSSLIVQKLESTPPFGSRMPLDGPPYLEPEEIMLIRDWIAEGAMEN